MVEDLSTYEFAYTEYWREGEGEREEEGGEGEEKEEEDGLRQSLMELLTSQAWGEEDKTRSLRNGSQEVRGRLREDSVTASKGREYFKKQL